MGLEWISLQQPGISIISSESTGIVSLNRYGNLYLGATCIPLFWRQWGNGYYQLQIGEQDNPLFPLSDLAFITSLFGGSTNINSFLPTALIDALHGIAVTDVTADILTIEQWVRELSLGFGYFHEGDLSGDWQITSSIILRNLRGRLVVKNPICMVDPYSEEVPDGMDYNVFSVNYMTEYLGEISGTFLLRTTEIPVMLSGGSDTDWIIGLQDDAAVTLPSLEQLLALIGEQELYAMLPSGLKEIPQIIVNELYARFNPSQQQLFELGVGVTSGGVWTVIDNYLTLENIFMDVRVRQENSSYEIYTDIRGTFLMDTIYVQASLRKQFRDSDWIISAYLAPGRTVSLTGIARRLLAGFVNLPDVFPDISFTTIDFTVTTTSQTYHFEASSTNPWPIHGSLGIENFAIVFDYSNNVISGSVSGDLVISSLAPISLLAALQANNHPGWLFQGHFASEDSENSITGQTFISEIASALGVHIPVPSILENIAITTMDFSYQTGTGDLLFSCVSHVPELDIILNVDIALTKRETIYDYQFRGTMEIDNLQFSLVFDDNTQQSQTIGVYNNLDQMQTSIKQLVTDFSAQLGQYIPDGMTFAVKDALVAYQSLTTENKTIFALDVDGGISLSNIPLIGQLFSPQDSLSFSIKPIAASADFTKQQVDELLKLIPVDTYPLPSQDYSIGLQFFTKLELPNMSIPVDFPVTTTSTGSLQTDPSQSPTGDPDITWWSIQKNFGPVHFGQLGFQYKDDNVYFYPQVSFSTNDLSIGLEGFSIQFDLNTFVPQFAITGLEIIYDSPELVVEGAFLKSTYDDGDTSYDEYSGLALLQTLGVSFSAIGSYADFEGHPSLFLYASIHIPLGGPPIFFVTGFAAGFGFNRKLTTPAIDEVQTFPLVQQAMGVTTTNAGTIEEQVRQEIETLHQWIPPSIGDQFFAIGIQFTSYKMIDSFALLIVSFGHKFVIDVLGMASMVIPCASSLEHVSPLAQVEMALETTFDPQQGFIGVEAQLTPSSYILSRDCHITGGFAFYAWFSGTHQGDFVQTMGGYHPQFQIPSHYPNVPLLGLNWNISQQIGFKGGVYFAMTPHALMAGGHLEATWRDGDLQAWFSAGVDFLLGWQPYYYDARLQVDVGASYKFSELGVHKTITAHANVDLHVWGPDFAGEATIDISVISFTISFNTSRSKSPDPLLWNQFFSYFLPNAENICSITVNEGLLGEIVENNSVNANIDPEKHWIIDRNSFKATVDSTIPSMAVYANSKDTVAIDNGVAFGVAPMSIQNSFVDSPQQGISSYIIVKIEKIVETENENGLETEETEETEDVTHLFMINGLKKNLPTALWGTKFKPTVNQRSLLAGGLTGVIISLKPIEQTAQETTIDQEQLMTDPQQLPADAVFVDLPVVTYSSQDDAQRRDIIASNILINTNRDELLAAMGIDNLTSGILLRDPENLAADYIIAPKLTSF